jgi:hypothetical protein
MAAAPISTPSVQGSAAGAGRRLRLGSGSGKYYGPGLFGSVESTSAQECADTILRDIKSQNVSGIYMSIQRLSLIPVVRIASPKQVLLTLLEALLHNDTLHRRVQDIIAEQAARMGHGVYEQNVRQHKLPMIPSDKTQLQHTITRVKSLHQVSETHSHSHSHHHRHHHHHHHHHHRHRHHRHHRLRHHQQVV